MLLTEDEMKARILTEVGDRAGEGPVAAQWSVYYDKTAGYDTTDPSGDLRYYSLLVIAIGLQLGESVTSVNESDGAGGSLSAGDWFTHLEQLRKDTLDTIKARLTAIASKAGISVGTLAATSLTPQLAGQVGILPDPNSPVYLGDPRYVWGIR